MTRARSASDTMQPSTGTVNRTRLSSSAHTTSIRARQPALLLLVLALFLGLACLYNAVIPLGEGPDEPGHLRYVLFLGREGRLPVQQIAAPEAHEVAGEGHQPPLAYLLALPAVAWLPPDAMQIYLNINPQFIWSGGAEPGAFNRSSQEYWPWRGTALAWHLARGISTLLGAITVVCTWGAARMLMRSHGFAHPHATTLPILAAALVALNPQFLFTSALVTNDALLTTLSAGLLWLCLAWIDHEARVPAIDKTPFIYPTLAGLLLGLALLTKQSALLLVPLLLWASWRAGQGNWQQICRFVAGWSLTALVVAGWWYGRNWQLYGDPFGLEVFRAEFLTQAFEWRDPTAWIAALAQLHASFWARFGWMSLRPPEWVIWSYGLLALAGLLGLLRYRSNVRPQLLLASPWIGVVLLPLLALAWTISFALTAGLVAWQGRMLFPALPAIAILLATGLLGWTMDNGRGVADQRPPTAARGSWLVIAGLLGLALYLPLGVVRPAYPWYVAAPAAAQERIATPVYARFAHPWEQGVELRGWRLTGTPRPGATITVTLTWHALEYIPRNWTVFVHLLDEEGRIVAEDNRRPLSGAFPMPQWTQGDWVEDPHPIDLPADLPPGVYQLNVGLYQPEQRGGRQTIWNADDEFVDDTITIGVVAVQ